MHRTSRWNATVVAILASAALGACSTSDRNTTDTTVGGAIDTTPAMASNAGDWTDAHILGFATVANMGEIQEAQLAQTKASNPTVKTFAREIETDHKALLDAGTSFAQSHNVSPDTAWDKAHDLANDAHDEIQDLRDKDAGPDWDEDYIEHQIDGHQKVLSTLQDAQQATTNADVRSMLGEAIAKVQAHLDRAKQIKDTGLKT